MPVLNGPFSQDDELTYDPAETGTSLGADAEIGRKQRELALAALSGEIERTRMASEPQALQRQRANINAHGTIEAAPEFERRTGMRDAADALDPSNPFGALRADDQRTKLAQIHESNVRPAEINAGVQREKIASDFDSAVLGAETEADTGRYRADADARARVESEVANQLIGGSFPKGPAERNQALQGFMQALDELRGRYRRPAAPPSPR